VARSGLTYLAVRAGLANQTPLRSRDRTSGSTDTALPEWAWIQGTQSHDVHHDASSYGGHHDAGSFHHAGSDGGQHVDSGGGHHGGSFDGGGGHGGFDGGGFGGHH
jgi:hypothetical protein